VIHAKIEYLRFEFVLLLFKNVCLAAQIAVLVEFNLKSSSNAAPKRSVGRTRVNIVTSNIEMIEKKIAFVEIPRKTGEMIDCERHAIVHGQSLSSRELK
jgi:hypothetical protein